jgi:hypothetical protein
MPATGKITVHVNGSQTAPLDLGTATFPFSTSGEANYAAGTAAGQIDRVFTDTRTLAASATENIDLAGVHTDAFGATLTFAKVRAIYVSAASGNTNDVQVTRPASNGVPWLMAAGDGIALRPGAFLAWASGTGDTNSVAVTPATGDLITFTNSAGTTGVTYTVVILGTSS